MARIKVKLGAAEAEVESDPDHLEKVIELVPSLVAKLPVAVPQRISSTAPETIQNDTKPDGASLSQLPNVSLDKNDSLAEVIGKFFSDSWGRDKRKLSDVRSALESYGLNYPKQSVAVALLRLAKTTKIRRFKAEDGEFVYTASSPGAALPSSSFNGSATLDIPSANDDSET